jgi:hypothetical protein
MDLAHAELGKYREAAPPTTACSGPVVAPVGSAIRIIGLSARSGGTRAYEGVQDQREVGFDVGGGALGSIPAAISAVISGMSERMFLDVASF